MKSFFKITKYVFVLILLLIVGFSFLNYYPDKTLDQLKEKYANAESEFMLLDSIKVHFRDEGNIKDSIPVVLIHGTGSNLLTWDKWTEKLIPTHRVIRLDLPAYGLTGPNSNNIYTTAYYVEFLNDFLEKLNVKNCYLIGNSLGGSVSWEFTAKYSEKVKKLILIDPAGFPLKKSGGALVFKIAKIPVLKNIFTVITPKSIVEKSMLDVYYDDTKVTDKLVEQYHDMACRAGNRAAFVTRINQKPIDNSARIASIKTRTLIMWGANDTWIPLENAYKFEKALSNDTLIIYPKTGHVPMEESPEMSVQDVIIFLKK
jgi:pimeloyl-ACP methyl ester carboxylesterase